MADRNDQNTQILGSDRFIQRAKKKINELSDEVPHVDKRHVVLPIETIVACICAYYGTPSTDIYTVKKGRSTNNRPRKLAMYLGQLLGDYRLNELAKIFGLKHYGGVSSAINTIKREIDDDKRLRQDVNSIINRLDP